MNPNRSSSMIRFYHSEESSIEQHYHQLSETCIFGVSAILLSVLFLLIIIANPIEEADNIVAVRNMRLYAPPLGNVAVVAAVVVVPFIFNICCWDCINIPAIAGPIALPMILIKLVIPVEIPRDCAGVASIIIFMTPTGSK